MRLPITCLECVREELGSEASFTIFEWNDEGRYQICCPKGHTSTVILQEQKFELLFDIGASAIIDGYYREAVSSFTSSLERFYEFFVTSVLLQSEITAGLVSDAWKLVSSQSERQLGAFIFLYLSKLKKPPALMSNKSVRLRNEVVHKGRIPSKKQAIEYGDEVLALMRAQLKELKQNFPAGVQKSIVEHIKRCRQEGDDRAGTVTIPTIISSTRSDDGYNDRTLEAAIEDLRRWMTRWKVSGSTGAN